MTKPNVRLTHGQGVSNTDILFSNALSRVLARGLLDKPTREAVRLFYDWYRHCEEISRGQVTGYGQISPADQGAGPLDTLYTNTYAAIFEMKFVDPLFEGLSRAVHPHGWPASVVLDVLDGFRMDVEGQSYQTVDDLMAYCYRIAGSVCVGLAETCGVDVKDPWVSNRACDLGLAIQLTNIALHVMDDAAAGRVYLPAELFLSGRASPAFILDPANRSAVVAATNVLLDVADGYYASATLAIGTLKWRLRWVVTAAAGACRAIATRIRWSDNPWPNNNPPRWWAKLPGAIASFSKLVVTTLMPAAYDADRFDHWTRSTDPRHRP